MRVFTAPEGVVSFARPAVFLGGAITGAPDWQTQAIDLLRPHVATCFNPRRPAGFLPPDHPDYLDSYRTQTEWEHRLILAADVVLFWLPAAALALTTRFEIGWCFGLASTAAQGSPPRPFAIGIEAGVQAACYYHIVLPAHGIPVYTTLAETCARAAKLAAPQR